MNTSYTPVSCDFHDELESLATLRQSCQLTYKDDKDEVLTTEGLIVDVYAANHADYIKLENGMEIRMDRIVSVNGKEMSSVSVD